MSGLEELLGGCGLCGLLSGGITAQPVVPVKVSDEDYNSTRVQHYAIRNREKYERLKAKLLEELENITIPRIPKPAPKGDPHTNRGNVIGTIGRTITFGFGDNRRGWNFYSSNKQYPEVFKALVEFGNAVVPKGWDYQGITVNHGVKAKKHKDKKNIGESVIVGLGDYTGGDLTIWDGNDKNPKDYDIKGKPALFNGGNLYHQTRPFKGNRYTIVFYKQSKKPARGEVGIGKGMGDMEGGAMSQPEFPEEGAVFG